MSDTHSVRSTYPFHRECRPSTCAEFRHLKNDSSAEDFNVRIVVSSLCGNPRKEYMSGRTLTSISKPQSDATQDKSIHYDRVRMRPTLS
jgi:hypothetical protein